MPMFGQSVQELRDANAESEKYFSALKYFTAPITPSAVIQQTLFCMVDVEWPTVNTYHYLTVESGEFTDSEIIAYCADMKRNNFPGLAKQSGLSFRIPGEKVPTRIVWYKFVDEEEFNFKHMHSSLFIKSRGGHSQLGNFSQLKDADGLNKIIRIDHSNTHRYSYSYGLNLISGIDTLVIDPSIHNEGD